MKQEIVCWQDARSDDGWVEPESLDMHLAKITTLGHIVKDTKHILCIASSVDARTGQLSGVMFIPQQCVLWRQEIIG